MLQDFPEISTSKAFNIVTVGNANLGKIEKKRGQAISTRNFEAIGERIIERLFQMATGSGKTFTALCAIRDAIYIKNEIPVIIVPGISYSSTGKRKLRKPSEEMCF